MKLKFTLVALLFLFFFAPFVQSQDRSITDVCNMIDRLQTIDAEIPKGWNSWGLDIFSNPEIDNLGAIYLQTGDKRYVLLTQRIEIHLKLQMSFAKMRDPSH